MGSESKTDDEKTCYSGPNATVLETAQEGAATTLWTTLTSLICIMTVNGETGGADLSGGLFPFHGEVEG